MLSHPFTFNLHVTLGLKWISCKQHWSCFFMHSVTVYLLIAVFGSFTFKVIIIKKIFFDLFIYFWERERERERASQSQRGRNREREGDTESEAGSRLRAVSTEPDVGFKLMNREFMTRAKVGRLTHWATQEPLKVIIDRYVLTAICYCFMVVFIVILYSFLLLLSSLMVCWISFVICLDSFLFTFCISITGFWFVVIMRFVHNKFCI